MIPLWTGRHDFPPLHRKPISINQLHSTAKETSPKANLRSPFCNLPAPSLPFSLFLFFSPQKATNLKN